MNNRGFTLMEVIIVVALMGILMAMATPSLVTWRENAQNKEIAREVLAGLRQARSTAVTESRTVTFSINPSTREMTINGTVKQLPAAISIRARAATTGAWLTGNANVSVEFAPQGNSSTLYQVQINEMDRLIVEINSQASGLARIN